VIVVGIDPSTRGFHAVALIGIQARTYTVAVEWQKLGLWALALQQVSRMASDMMASIEEDRGPDEPVMVFIEEPLVAGRRNLRTALQMAQVVGAIVGMVVEWTNRVYLVPVSTWKVNTVGKGNASKEDVAGWLTRYHSVYAAACDGRQDLIDACCIACYGRRVADDSSLVIAEADY